jgi:hypothetical protein
LFLQRGIIFLNYKYRNFSQEAFMAAKLKIFTMALALAATAVFAGGGKHNKEEWKAFKECKQRVEQGASEDCSAFKPAKAGKEGKKGWKRDGKKEWKGDGKKGCGKKNKK